MLFCTAATGSCQSAAHCRVTVEWRISKRNLEALRLFEGYGGEDDSDSEGNLQETPFEVENVSASADEAKHFVLTEEQWTQLRTEVMLLTPR